MIDCNISSYPHNCYNVVLGLYHVIINGGVIRPHARQTLHFLATRSLMATHHGQITEFSGNSDDWEAYVEQLENYFEANEIESAAKKRAILLSPCGTATYKTIRSILAPKKPTEVEYAELVRQVKQHYAPKPSEIIQRYKFYTCNRQPSEFIADYVARLRALTEYCEFGETLNSMLRDQLVCGVNKVRAGVSGQGGYPDTPFVIR